MALTPRLFIAIPCFNRFEIAQQCLPTIKVNRWDCVGIFNDGSTEYRGSRLRKWCDWLFDRKERMGIEWQRRRHFRIFWRCYEKAGFTHFYLTDADALHDPSWRSEALHLQDEYGGAPVCLYNTAAHVRLSGNTIEDNPGQYVIWRRYAPGISYLLTVEHVRNVMRHIDQMTNWDWQVCDWLGNRMAISRRSFVDHIGRGGIHHPENEGFNGGDVALNPTSFLVDKRAEVISILSKE